VEVGDDRRKEKQKTEREAKKKKKRVKKREPDGPRKNITEDRGSLEGLENSPWGTQGGEDWSKARTLGL